MIIFKERCVHCEHASESVWCCFCEQYIYRSGNITFKSDVPIVVTDVGVEPGLEYER